MNESQIHFPTWHTICLYKNAQGRIPCMLLKRLLVRLHGHTKRNRNLMMVAVCRCGRGFSDQSSLPERYRNSRAAIFGRGRDRSSLKWLLKKKDGPFLSILFHGSATLELMSVGKNNHNGQKETKLDLHFEKGEVGFVVIELKD